MRNSIISSKYKFKSEKTITTPSAPLDEDNNMSIDAMKCVGFDNYMGRHDDDVEECFFGEDWIS
jgi:hypothetical protein